MDIVSLESERRQKQIVTATAFPIILIGGWFYPLLGYFIPLCMLLGMGIASFRGRKWCDWLCPRGSFWDVALRPVSRHSKDIPPLFKGWPLRVAVLSLLMVMMTIQLVKRWPDPDRIGQFFVVLLTVTTIVGAVLGVLVHDRTWCCFCPIGTMANWIGRRRYPLQIKSPLCVDCKKCKQVCPLRIAPYEFKGTEIQTVADGDCLKCDLCVKACPKRALQYQGDPQ